MARIWLVAAMMLAAHTAFGQDARNSTSRLTVAFAAEPTTVDPAQASAGVDSYGVSQMFEQLARPGRDGKWMNWLAESWSLKGTKDKPVIEVKLRPGVTFHNGDPLTSADMEFSFQRQKNPKISRRFYFFDSVDRFEIVDDLTFRIHFKEPDANFVAAYFHLYAMPKKYIEQVGEEEFAKNPVGTGPWKFRSWKPKEEMVFEAFDGYWNKEARPTVRNLVVKLIPEDLTRVAAFKTGAVDLIDAVPLAAVTEFKNQPNTKTATLRTGNNLNLAFPTHMPGNPFIDQRVRLAAAHAIDMDAIIKTVLFGQAERYAEVAEGATGYNPDLKPFAYDPKKARQLLAEAGFPRGFDTPCYNFTTQREPNLKEVGEAIFAYFSAVGIRCKIVGVEYAAWLNLIRRWPEGSTQKVMDGAVSSMYGHTGNDVGNPWAATMHCYQPARGFGSSSNTCIPEVDRMIEEQKREMDPEKRIELIRKLAKIKHEQVLAGVTTYRPLVTFAWRDNVQYTPWPLGSWRSMLEIGFKK